MLLYDEIGLYSIHMTYNHTQSLKKEKSQSHTCSGLERANSKPRRGSFLNYFWTSSLHVVCFCNCYYNYAPINVKPAGGAGHGVGIWLFSKICSQIPCPRANHSSQLQPNFPTPVKYTKAGPKKGTIKISPNKTLKYLFILRCRITSCSCYSCNYTF